MAKKQQELSPHLALKNQLQAQRDVVKRYRERAISKIIDWEQITDYAYIRDIADRTNLTIGQVKQAIESLNRKRNPRKKLSPEKKGKVKK
jgi:DNA-binding MarR family transcriptional regulator